jgi:flagellar biosynthesis/type III secretory pathway M-ring protein FliF/YscJ
MNWVIIIIVGVLAVALIVFLIIRNQKDEKEFEGELNNDYPKPRDEEGDIEIDEITKSVH